MHRPADLVVINIGTNDWRSPNDLPKDDYYNSYIKLIDEIHSVWPDTQIIIMVRLPSIFRILILPVTRKSIYQPSISITLTMAVAMGIFRCRWNHIQANPRLHGGHKTRRRTVRGPRLRALLRHNRDLAT